MDSKHTYPRTLDERLHEELIDAVDEELELELDDHRLAGLLEHVSRPTQHALAVAALGPPLDRVPLNRPKWLEASAMRVIWHFAELRS